MQYKAIGDNPNINYAIVGNKNLYETLERNLGGKMCLHKIRIYYLVLQKIFFEKVFRNFI